MADETATIAYAWVLDGVSQIFVSDEALDDAWAVTSSFLTTHHGLQLPTGLVTGVNLRTGYPDPSIVTIKAQDVHGTLAAMFGANRFDADDLVTTLQPGVTAGSSLYSKHVGVEAIGSMGERRQYSCIPGFNVGLLHLGQNDAFAVGAGSAPVSDDPVLWEGRRCAMYRVKKVAGTWQALSAADRVWWGTLRGAGTQHMERWSFRCHGPESWLGGNLGTGNSQEGLRTLPVLEIVEDGFGGQAVIRGDLWIARLDTPVEVRHNYVYFSDSAGTDVDNELSGVSSYADIATGLNSFLDGLVADTTNGDEFEKYGNDIYFDTAPGSDGITVKWYVGDAVSEGDPYLDSDSADSERVTVYLRLTMHEVVWKALGYDVHQQTRELDPLEHEDQYARFEAVGLGPGYYSGLFHAASPKAMKGFESNDHDSLSQEEYSSGGGTRRWPPLYELGAVSFTGEVGQEFQLASPDDVRMLGSKSRPLMADPDDNSSAFTLGDGVGDVTTQGLVVFRGPFRRRGDANQVDPVAGYSFQIARERREGETVQVARVCWKEASGLVSKDTDNYGRFVIYEWLDPRLFGFDFLLFEGAWGGHRDPPPGAKPITAWPLTAWEYSDSGDIVSTVMQRILLTTGTAGGWYEDDGFVTPLYGLGAGEAYLDVGDNDSGGDQPKDGEVPGSGLGIPSSMVAAPADWAEAGTHPGQHLGRCKAVVVGAASSTHLLTTLLAPTGLALGYSGGKYGIFDPWRSGTPADSVLTVTTETYAGEPGGDAKDIIPSQELRMFQAIDRIKISARIEPIDREYHEVLTRNSSDVGAAYRSTQIEHRIAGDHMLDPSIPTIGADWPSDVPVRWREGFDFWAAPHTTFTAPLHTEDALDIWPGDTALITDPWLLSQAGVYGVSLAVCRCLSKSHDAVKQVDTVKFMLSAESEFRMYAPRAEVTRYDEQDIGAEFRLLCKDDAFGDRAGVGFDVEGFAEPSWSTEGGDATIEVFQFDGTTWSGGIYGEVDTVTGATSDSYITLTGAMTGATWYPDRHSVVVLRVWASQVAWPKRWYAAICEEDGTHTSSTAGEKWRGI